MPKTGGVPLRTRPRPRRRYHQVELDRWRTYLGMPLVLEPKHYPQAMPADPDWNKYAGWTVIAAQDAGLDAFPLSHAILRALWAEERDIRSPTCAGPSPTRTATTARSWWRRRRSERVQALYRQFSAEAETLGVFGAPTFVIEGELFWGQDRLDFVDRRARRHPLAARRSASERSGKTEETRMRRLRFALALIGALAAGASGPAAAQKWPEKPITVIMGFPAGSGVDVIARLLQAPLEKDLGTQLVFDYKVGAGGNVASEVVAKARPDGYTILLGTSATHGVNAALYKKLPFDVEADFTPIAPLNDVSNVLTINPAVIDAGSVQDFIAKVKAEPGKYNYASTGNGTGTHLAFAQFVQDGRPRHGARALQGRPGGPAGRGDGRGVLHHEPGADGAAANGAPARCGCSASPPSSASAPCRTCRPSPRPACPATKATSGSACSAPRGSTPRSPRRSTSP